MPTIIRYPAMALALAFCGYATGCQANKPSDHFDVGATHGTVAVVGSDVVAIDYPSIDISHGNLVIYGTVHRKPGISGDLPGRIDIEFLSSNGEYLDGLPALLNPHSVPEDTNEAATYSTTYGYIPPVGSIIRVHFVDHDTQVREDLEGGDMQYSATGAKGVGTVNNHTTSTPTHHNNASGNIGGNNFGNNMGKSF